MSESESTPPAGGTTPPSGGQQQPAPPPSGQQPPPVQPSAQPGALDDVEDSLFEVKDGDPAWVKRLRVTAARYRTERNEFKGKYEGLVQQNEQRDQQTLSQRREEVAKKHGLWDDQANDGKGGLLPGIDLGKGDTAEMERVANAIVSKLRPVTGSNTGATGRRPATLTSTTSGTSDRPQPGAGRAASAVRDMMRNRASGSTG